MKLCIALDLNSKKDNLNLIKKIKTKDIWLKIGLRSFVRDGKDFIDELKQINPNFKIFLDLKLYDIPNTMATTAYEIANMNIDMFNIHASSGYKAMNEVMNTIKEFPNPPLVLSVTALTSFDNDTFFSIYNDNIKSKAISFAKLSYKAGINGVVCSVYESLDIKQKISNDFITLTPGIRPFDTSKGDQKRVATINEAKKNLSNFIVIGRPIYQNRDPYKIVCDILDEINRVN